VITATAAGIVDRDVDLRLAVPDGEAWQVEAAVAATRERADGALRAVHGVRASTGR
jgi:hypothetical protein